MDNQGRVMGLIPYDYRRPSLKRYRERMWNPGEEKLVTPKATGVGWTFNFYQLREKYPHLFYILLALVAIRAIIKARRVNSIRFALRG